MRLGIAFAQNSELRESQRAKIRRDRDSSRLFDTDVWTKGMEAALQRVWDASVGGKSKWQHVAAV